MMEDKLQNTTALKSTQVPFLTFDMIFYYDKLTDQTHVFVSKNSSTSNNFKIALNIVPFHHKVILWKENTKFDLKVLVCHWLNRF